MGKTLDHCHVGMAVFAVAGCLVMGSVLAGAAPGAPAFAAPLKSIRIGDGTLDLSMQLRLRYEVFDNFDKRRYGTGETDAPLQERLRLSASYHPAEDVEFFLELQDNHYWGSKTGVSEYGITCPFQNPLDLHQAYLLWEHIGGTPLGIKIGRQSISYADNRIWGPGDWGNTGRYLWDAAKVVWDDEWATTDLILAKQVLYDKRSIDNNHLDPSIIGVYSRLKKLPATCDLFYVLQLNDQGETKGEDGLGNLKSHTVGAYVNGKICPQIDYQGTFAYQFGDWGQDRIDAYGLNASAGYTFAHPWKPRLGLEYSYASGDSDPTDGVRETFSAVLGAVDTKYGRVNLFNWMNLQDYQAAFSIAPTKRLKILLEGHHFRLADDNDAWYWASGKAMGRDMSGSTNPDLGQEVDLTVWYSLSSWVKLMAGYGHFFSGPFARMASSRAGDADWGFFQTTIEF